MSSRDDPEARKKAEEKAKADRKEKYEKKLKVDPTTEEAEVNPADLAANFFKDDQWGPQWAVIEFDDDACLMNVTKAGKEKDGYYAPAGTILPLGAALPKMTVLKYGGFFPPGTSFPGGVLVPLHARMVNILPQKTKPDGVKLPEESICSIQ
ncbi:hypothetical protein TREMEDRAFT_64365 [Tremella mesenterica DSM 1558]|uniref:uncharacterized protein n=1 Tax=Tremella mesenterica (strain ATCC 24925 / CBS 8224 / DSM 1558 / NBRC 9311 / NRRL Y-6157 / RJB 2259-6 / UBC 559-6) TaxID=578456 RepID=UPI0003F4A58A|nr:uncharacterized protein TREMEDRAFT_64365 [Tremella mesenterica DSM 1558]EIW67772.1 hypothetical protein TREMEDRAFT_64365 [Tremella mesenterica DSM 1558]